jgi:RNA polymerase sigma-70 factor, ECF subfamily
VQGQYEQGGTNAPISTFHPSTIFHPSAIPGGPDPHDTAEIDTATSARDLMLAAIPPLRAFAISLCGNADRADDLVQETLSRAWAHIDSYRPGSMTAWLVTILRNVFYSEYRKRRREVADSDGHYARTLMSPPTQTSGLELGELLAALAALPPDKREALILVGAAGFSYQETADICGCAVGTVKSRINRARALLAELMSATSAPMTAPIKRAVASPSMVL